MEAQLMEQAQQIIAKEKKPVKQPQQIIAKEKTSGVLNGGSVDGNEENSSNGTPEHKSSVEVGESRDVDDRDSHLEVHESSVQVQTGNDKNGLKYRSGIQLHMADNYALRMKHANRRKGKGKKMGNIAKHRMLESTGRTQEIGVARIGGRRFVKQALESERTKRQDGENGEEKQLNAKTTDAFADLKLLKPEVSADTRSMSNERNTTADQPDEDVQEKDINQITPETHKISSDDPQLNITVDGEGKGTSRDAGEDKHIEDGGEVHKDCEQRDSAKADKSAEKDKVPEDLEAEDLHESDTDISRESSSTQEDDKEGKEETDEPDF